MYLFPLCLHKKSEVQSVINPQAFEATRGSQFHRICPAMQRDRALEVPYYLSLHLRQTYELHNRGLLPGVFGGPCQGCQIVYVGPCGSMAEKVFYVGCIICLYFQLVILSQKLEGFISTGQPKEKQTELPIHFP